MLDKRRHLRVKIKSLAEEARIIRHEERLVRGMDRWELQQHRKTVVRDEARRSLIAYAIIREKDPTVHMSHDGRVDAEDQIPVARMVRRYGSKESEIRLQEYLRAA